MTRSPTFLLPYLAPYHWTAMLAFLAARAVPATEQVVGSTYRRSLRVPVRKGPEAGEPTDALLAGTVTVSDEPQRQALRVELSPSLSGSEEENALRRIGQMFDIGCDPRAVAAVLGDLAQSDPGLRLPGSVDPFEIVVRAILGQQITVAAARTIASRFVAAFGQQLPGLHARPGSDKGSAGCDRGPTHLFPSAGAIACVDPSRLGEIGIIRSRAQAIVAVACALSSGLLRLEARAPVEPALAALTAVRGIGPWTAHYVAMRTIGWTDAFPPGDVVVLKALRVATPAAAAALACRWHPWRSYAVLHLWRRSSISVN